MNNGRRNYDPGIKEQCFFIAGKEEFFLLTSMLQDAALCFSFGGFSGGQGGYMNNRDKHVQFKANIMCARLSSRRSMPRNVFLKRRVGMFESVCVYVCDS